MEMKKIFCQSIIGIVSIALFTGCSRDIIEHQFHVDVETQKESVTDIIDAEENTKEFEEYLKQHGFETQIALITNTPDDLFSFGTTDPLDDVSLSDISQERLDNWVNNPDSKLCIYTECEKDSGLYGQIPIVMNHMNTFYLALQSLGDNWEEGEAFQDKENMYLLSSMVEQDGKYYIETILTTKYSRV